MQTISLNNTWLSTLPTLLMVYGNAETHEARQSAFDELRKMAIFADAFGKELCIELYAMTGDTITEPREEPEHYDVLVRPEGEDPIFEFENLTWDKASSVTDDLVAKLPGATFAEIGG